MNGRTGGRWRRGRVPTGVAITGATVLLVLSVLSHLWRGPGEGGTGDEAAQDAPATTQVAEPNEPPPVEEPTGPLEIFIDGEEYVVDGERLELAGLRAVLEARDAEREVIVERRDTSRARTEIELEALLERMGVRALWREGRPR